MSYLFKQSQQVLSLQSAIVQNNDLYEGREALILNIDNYYDGLELDTADKKLARWKRTPFYLFYPKIVSSFNSSIFKKPPHYEMPASITDEKISNVDLLGNNLNEYVAQIPEQVLKHGFCATIIDYSNELKKPFFTFVKPESFVSFKTKNINGYPELSQFIYSVFEDQEDPADEFSVKTVKVHYVWDIETVIENNETINRVRVRKYVRLDAEPDKTNKAKKGDKTEQSDVLESTNYVTLNNKPLDKLPIIIHGKETNNYSVDKSVLQDVSDLNINLFQRVTDLIEVLHLTAMPTPWISGADPTDKTSPTTIGSSKLWYIPEGERAGLIEFSGESVKAHREYIEDLKEAMAVTGAQILKKQGVSRETATSVLIRTGQETAIITDIVINISSQVVEALKFYCKWLGEESEDIKYKLNSDFVSVDMEPNAQIALVRSWLDGAISFDSMFNKLKEGEIIPANRTIDDEKKLINDFPPKFPAKEKDAENAKELAKLNSSLNPTNEGGSQTDNPTKGSNLEIDNGTKNTEIKN